VGDRGRCPLKKIHSALVGDRGRWGSEGGEGSTTPQEVELGGGKPRGDIAAELGGHEPMLGALGRRRRWGWVGARGHTAAVCRRMGWDCYLRMVLDDGRRQPSPSPVSDLDANWSTF
jgi:hypothetical protein